MSTTRITEQQIREFMHVLWPIQQRLKKRYGVRQFKAMQNYTRQRREQHRTFDELNRI